MNNVQIIWFKYDRVCKEKNIHYFIFAKIEFTRALISFVCSIIKQITQENNISVKSSDIFCHNRSWL
ncbi:unnamed protein product [Tenebrio molitor]|nr:unnamed protein product [Tenebrio molitor]